MRESQRGEVVEEEPQEPQEETQREPEEEPLEPTHGLNPEGGDVSDEAAEEDIEEEEEEPEPPEQWPSVEEYKLKWDRFFGQHSAVTLSRSRFQRCGKIAPGSLLMC